MFLNGVNEWILIGVLFLALNLAYQLGYKWGQRKNRVKASSHSSVVLAQLTGLIGFLGILLAFTFSMADSRFETRKQLVVQESLNIGTTYFRLGLIEDSIQRERAREIIREYLQDRINLYSHHSSSATANEDATRSESLQVKLWRMSAILGRSNPNINSSLIIQSLNSMIDVTGSIQGAVQNRVPALIVIIDIIIALFTITTMGYSHGFLLDKNWTFAISLNLIISAIVLLIIDMDRPTSGILTVDVQSLLDLKNEIIKYDKWN